MAKDVRVKLAVDADVNKLHAEIQKIDKELDAIISKQRTINIKGIDQLTARVDALKSQAAEMQRTSVGIGFSEFNDLDSVSDKLGNLKAEFNNTQFADNFSKSLLNIASSGEITTGSLKSLLSTLGPYGAVIMGIVTVFNSLNKVMESFKDDAKSFGGIVEDVFIDGFEDFISLCESTIDRLSQINDEMNKFVELGVEAQDGYFTLFNYLGEEAGEEIVAFTDKLESLYNLDASSLVGDMRGMLAVVSNMNLSGDELTKYAESLTLFTQDLSAFSGTSREAVTSQLEAAINMNVLNSRSALARALDLTDKEIKQFKSLNTQEERAQFLLAKGTVVRGTYNKYLQTSAGKVEQLNQQYSSLNNNLGQLALGLYAKVAPLLTKLINLANTLVSSLIKVFNIDLSTGASNMANNTGIVASGLNDVAESAKEVDDGLTEVDDVMSLDRNSSSTNIDGMGLGDMDWSAWLGDIEGANEELSEFEKMLQRVQEYMENGQFYEAGQEIINFFHKFLSDISWDEIKSKADNLGKGIAEFMNGLLSNESAYIAIGETFAEALNTGMTFLYSFAENLKFWQLGEALAGAWKGFWVDFDSELLADTLYTWFSGAFETSSTFINDLLNTAFMNVDEDEILNGFEIVGYKLANVINEFFNNLSEDDIDNISDTIIGIINGVFMGIGEFLEEVDTEQIKTKIYQLFTKIGTELSENGEEWGEIVGELIKGLLNGIQFAIASADSTGIIDGLMKFIEGLDIPGIVSEWVDTNIAKLWLKLELVVPMIFDFIGGLFSNSIRNYQTFVEVLFGDAVDGVGNYLWTKITNLGTRLIKSLKDNVLNPIISLINSMLRGINSKLSGDGIIGKAARSLGFNGAIPEIPMLANGGIVEKATIALMGEQGYKEMVVPLERHTEWMDTIADKVVNRIGGTGGTSNNTSINLDMRSINKPVYTNSEMIAMGRFFGECMRLAGVKVSIAY